MTGRIKRTALILALAAGALLLSGCVSSMLADLAIKAPNQQQVPRAVRNPQYAAKFDAVYAQAWRVPVGPPVAELAVAVVEPGDYQFKYAIEQKQNERGHKWLEPQLDWTLPPVPQPAKGTVLILHGYRDAKENVAHWALCLAQAGYRCVLVDLRGHGRSTGDTISFGAFEVHDLTLVIDDLQKKGLMSDRVGVLGISYGASMALLLAAQDRRVAAVVALEPFSDAAKAVVEFAHGVAPSRAAKISDASFAAGVTTAARRGNFSWDAGDVLAAMDRVTAPVLFYHGAKDTWLSPDNSRALQARARGSSRLVILENDDHLLLSMRLGTIVPEVYEWFEEYLRPAAP